MLERIHLRRCPARHKTLTELKAKCPFSEEAALLSKFVGYSSKMVRCAPPLRPLPLPLPPPARPSRPYRAVHTFAFTSSSHAQAHSCVEKAGMIACVKLRQLDIDENYALRGHTLARAIEVCVHQSQSTPLACWLLDACNLAVREQRHD